MIKAPSQVTSIGSVVKTLDALSPPATKADMHFLQGKGNNKRRDSDGLRRASTGFDGLRRSRGVAGPRNRSGNEAGMKFSMSMFWVFIT